MKSDRFGYFWLGHKDRRCPKPAFKGDAMVIRGLYLVDELLLLAFAASPVLGSGGLAQEKNALGATVLADLFLARRIRNRRGILRLGLEVVDSTSLGHPLLDQAIHDIDRKSDFPGFWAWQFSRDPCLRTGADYLRQAGFLEKKESHALYVFSRTGFFETESGASDVILSHFREVIERRVEPHPGVAFLIFITWKTGILRDLLGGRYLGRNRRRLREIESGFPVSFHCVGSWQVFLLAAVAILGWAEQ